MPPFRKIIYVNASVMNVTCRKEKTRVDSLLRGESWLPRNAGKPEASRRCLCDFRRPSSTS
jgi:hypothetical protein